MVLGLEIVFLVVGIILTIIVLLQEGKSGGLTESIGGGSTDTYWGKNKGRSKEGFTVKSTKFIAILFIVLAIVLNMGFLK